MAPVYAKKHLSKPLRRPVRIVERWTEVERGLRLVPKDVSSDL